MTDQKIRLRQLEYPDDCLLIQKVLLAHGLDATLTQCAEIWLKASNELCASWLTVDEGHVWSRCREVIEVSWVGEDFWTEPRS